MAGAVATADNLAIEEVVFKEGTGRIVRCTGRQYFYRKTADAEWQGPFSTGQEARAAFDGELDL